MAQQQEIIDAINQRLGGAAGATPAGAAGGGHGRPDPSGAGPAGQGAGFSVATDELNGYVRQTRRLADELHDLARRPVSSVQTIAEDSFGRIGKETGFATALNHFADALELQVNGVAKNADALGESVAKTAKTYQHQDQELAQDILDLIT
ncbi:MAG: type VII secretion target [Labedaea sp.]